MEMKTAFHLKIPIANHNDFNQRNEIEITHFRHVNPHINDIIRGFHIEIPNNWTSNGIRLTT